MGEMEHGRRDCVCGNQWGEGRNAWEVAPVSLTAKGTDPLRMAIRNDGGDTRMNCVLSSSAWGRRFRFLVVGPVSVDVVNGESKSHVFVGWLSGRKDCFDMVELCAMVGEQGPIVVQGNGQR